MITKNDCLSILVRLEDTGVENIDTYSLDDIEAKLSIICVRNRVSFNLDENNKNGNQPTIYNLNNGDTDDDIAVPAWVKSLRETAKTM